jgi:glycosyltransferase involved in cell wall biosynthesis
VSSKICAVIPAYEASKTVGDVVRGALKYIPRVIVADDGSGDNTSGVASAAGADVIRIDKNRGKGNALKLLFKKAVEEGYDAVISLDADGQHAPEEIPGFLEAHALHPNDVIVGSRMQEREKIPRARFNSMHIARFYISLVSNQFVEDTQCGFRLYPLSLIKKIRLMTERYVPETELLMKAGDMGASIRFVKIRTIYGENGSHFRPVADIADITSYVISYVYVKWLIEGASSKGPNMYTPRGHLRDMISRNRNIDLLFRIFTVLTAVPASVLFLLEYTFLRPFIPNNFASIRRLGCGFSRITLASHMLPVVLIVALIEKTANLTGIRVNLVDNFILRFFPFLWKVEKQPARSLSR